MGTDGARSRARWGLGVDNSAHSGGDTRSTQASYGSGGARRRMKRCECGRHRKHMRFFTCVVCVEHNFGRVVGEISSSSPARSRVVPNDLTDEESDLI